jgi:transglutaminase-like putative cysteine protease
MSYLGENRMLSWKLDNSDWDYSYVQGYAYVDMKGARTMQIIARKDIVISTAASGQPNYLGIGMLTDRVSKKKRAMIDPSDNEIKAMAERLRNETGSDDTWTVARAIFLWLKENNQYYHGPESDNYTQSAIETLHNKQGDCDELSYLYISLLRAAGIPARYVDGYLVSSNASGKFISHTWVEFYDGEWVPVEVADTGLFGQEEANWDADSRIGIQLPDHIRIFVDDGSEDMRSSPGAQWIYNYYDKLPSISDYTYFDSVSYDSMYLTVCADGTRTLAKDKE